MDAERNAIFGWAWIAVGMAFGLALGLFSFEGPVPAPPSLDDYSGLPRRLLRLSHIAFIALGALNVLYAHDAAGRKGSMARRGGALLLLGSALLPPALAMPAFFPALKPLFALPAIILAAAAAWIAWDRRRGPRPERRRDPLVAQPRDLFLVRKEWLS